MLVPQLLLKTLEGLSKHDFKKFKWYLGLNNLKNCKRAPLSHLLSPHRCDTVSKMIDSYGEEMAVNVTVAILKKMKHNSTAEELEKTYTEGAAAQEKVSRAVGTSPSSSALGLPNDQKISTDGAVGAITPRASNATDDSMTISGNVCRNVGSIVSSNDSMNISGNVHRNVGNIIISNGSMVISHNVSENAGCIVGRNIGMIISNGNACENLEDDFGRIVVTNGDVIISGNIVGDIAGDVSDIIGINGKVIISGNIRGNVGPFVGCKSGLLITGNVRGNVWGNRKVIVSGNVRGNVWGTDATDGSLIVTGNVRGNVGGNPRVMISGNVRGNVGGAVGGAVEDSVGDFVDSFRNMIIRDAGHHVSLSTNKCKYLGFKNPIGNRTDFDSDSDSDSD